MNTHIWLHSHASLAHNRYRWLPFWRHPVGDMSQRKMEKIFKDLPNMFGIGDSILVVGSDSNGQTMTTHYGEYCKYSKRRTLNLNKQILFSGVHQFYFWWDYFQGRQETRSENAKTFKQVFSKYSISMQATKALHIIEDIKDVECKLPNIILQSKGPHKRRFLHEVLWWNKISVPRNKHIWGRIAS